METIVISQKAGLKRSNPIAVKTCPAVSTARHILPSRDFEGLCLLAVFIHHALGGEPHHDLSNIAWSTLESYLQGQGTSPVVSKPGDNPLTMLISLLSGL